jgi:hypothetical protein
VVGVGIDLFKAAHVYIHEHVNVHVYENAALAMQRGISKQADIYSSLNIDSKPIPRSGLIVGPQQ